MNRNSDFVVLYIAACLIGTVLFLMSGCGKDSTYEAGDLYGVYLIESGTYDCDQGDDEYTPEQDISSYVFPLGQDNNLINTLLCMGTLKDGSYECNTTNIQITFFQDFRIVTSGCIEIDGDTVVASTTDEIKDYPGGNLLCTTEITAHLKVVDDLAVDSLQVMRVFDKVRMLEDGR
jgi:hypothetical protein